MWRAVVTTIVLASVVVACDDSNDPDGEATAEPTVEQPTVRRPVATARPTTQATPTERPPLPTNTPVPPPPPREPTDPPPPPVEESNCSPAYPDTCIPPAPPDLDCGDVSARRFRVLSPDPHGFDADGDGVGCESG